MARLKTLPFMKDAKFIIIDEGLDAMYARTIVAGWLKMFTEKDANHTVELFSFFDPKSSYKNEAEPFNSPNVNIHDFHTLDINGVHQEDFTTLKNIIGKDKTKSTVVVDCLSSLIIYCGSAYALWFLESLSRQVQQLICIFRRDIIQIKSLKIHTLGTTYLKLNEYPGLNKKDHFTYMVDLVHRKVRGSILKQTEIVNQDTTTYEIQSEKFEVEDVQIDKAEPTLEEKIQPSFRINTNAIETKQREETVLPYTINTSSSNTSKIFYQPDDVDDIDEEDPDDDLCI